MAEALRQEGLEKGLEKGLAEGERKGRLEELRRIVMNLLHMEKRSKLHSKFNRVESI